jgi:hypothetical protein
MTVRTIIQWADDDDYDELSSSFARACRAADAAIADRPMLEPIPIVAQHGVPSASALQRMYERAVAQRRALYGPTRATLKAAAYLARSGDAKRFERWLMTHSPQEQAAMLAYLRRESSRKD